MSNVQSRNTEIWINKLQMGYKMYAFPNLKCRIKSCTFKLKSTLILKSDYKYDCI